jgi:hypothetical protein
MVAFWEQNFRIFRIAEFLSGLLEGGEPGVELAVELLF